MPHVVASVDDVCCGKCLMLHFAWLLTKNASERDRDYAHQAAIFGEEVKRHNSGHADSFTTLLIMMMIIL